MRSIIMLIIFERILIFIASLVGCQTSFRNSNNTIGTSGFTAVRGEDGFLYYAAEGRHGELVATEFVVGKVNPASKGIKKGLKDKSPQNCDKRLCKGSKGPKGIGGNDEMRKLRSAEVDVRRLNRPLPKVGILKNLVIPIRFADHTTRPLPSRDDIDILMNSKTPHATLAKTGSVWSVFNENSYGKLDLQSTVVDWVDTKFNETQIGNGTSG
jgi:hypothetical protein